MVNREAAADNLIKNIEFIKEEKALSKDADLCKAAGITKATLSTIKKTKRLPMIYPFFEKICDYSGYRIDDLLSKDLRKEKEENRPLIDESMDEEFRNYEGVYAAYYFNTTAVKGREKKDDDEALKFAVILIYRDKDGSFRCIGDFGLTREQQAERFNSCFTRSDNGKLIRNRTFKSDFNNRYSGDKLYDGEFAIHDSGIVMNLQSTQDSLTMMINRLRKKTDKYLGGLAAAISISTSVYPSPVLQVVGLSRGLLAESSAQIAAMLQLPYPALECGPEDEDDIYDMIRSIVDGHENPDSKERSAYSLTMTQERAILLTAMNRAINNTVRHNLARTYQVTLVDEENWYRTVKRFEEE